MFIQAEGNIKAILVNLSDMYSSELVNFNLIKMQWIYPNFCNKLQTLKCIFIILLKKINPWL